MAVCRWDQVDLRHRAIARDDEKDGAEKEAEKDYGGRGVSVPRGYADAAERHGNCQNHNVPPLRCIVIVRHKAIVDIVVTRFRFLLRLAETVDKITEAQRYLVSMIEKCI